MNANKKEKAKLVKEIQQKISDSKGLVVATYQGLSVKEMQELRKLSKEKDVELKVYKNRLFKIAAKNAGFEKLNDSLTGANIFAFGMSDDISPSKVLAEFAKKHKQVEFVTGIYEGKVVDANELKVVASLPTLEEALTMLAMQLMAPVKYVGVGLHQLTESDHLNGGSNEKSSSNEESK